MEQPTVDIEIKKVETKQEETLYKDYKRVIQPIIEEIARQEQKKIEKQQMINKQKEIKPGVFYIAFYKVRDAETNDRIDFGLVGLFDNHYLAMKACKMTKQRLTAVYEDDDEVYIKVEYTELINNHIIL